ncbi:MAG: UDP-2,3-diacylglucosamine diphosphatase [Wenzhouxiangella sp.]
MHLISDLHLDQSRPEVTQRLIDYLNGPASRADSLYILGDLFDVWIGDDAADPVGEQLIEPFRRLSAGGTRIYFMAGNRDFLLGDDYCQRAGIQRIAEPLRLEGVEPATLLMHGDTLCTDDAEYQRFRRKVRNPDWQRKMLGRPLVWRRLLARLARALSRWRNRSKALDIMDVNAGTVEACFRQHQVQRLIHGHTHRPAVHDLQVDGQPCERLVLSDWDEDRGSVIELRDGQARLVNLLP